MVGGRRVGVGADHEAGAAVEEMPEGLLLAGGFGMHVDDDRVRDRPQGAGRQFPLGRGEGIVQRIHVDAAHHVQDEDAGALLGLHHRRPRPGVPGG